MLRACNPLPKSVPSRASQDWDIKARLSKKNVRNNGLDQENEYKTFILNGEVNKSRSVNQSGKCFISSWKQDEVEIKSPYKAIFSIDERRLGFFLCCNTNLKMLTEGPVNDDGMINKKKSSSKLYSRSFCVLNTPGVLIMFNFTGFVVSTSH